MIRHLRFGCRMALCAVLTLLCTSVFTFSQNFTIGTGTSGNNNSGYPCPLQDWYEGSRMQFLYLASDLQGAGMVPGNITAISYNVAALNGAGTITNFTVKITGTSVSSLSTGSWEPGTATVYTNANYQPVTGANTFTFTTPYTWNGADNILIEICNGSNTSGYTNNPTIYYQTVGYNANHTYRADNAGNLCNTNTVTHSGAATLRPNITFSLTPATPCMAPISAGTASASAPVNGVPYVPTARSHSARLGTLLLPAFLSTGNRIRAADGLLLL